MFKNKFAIILAAGLVVAGLALAPAQLLAQGVGGSAPPPSPGTRAAPSGGVGGSAMPARPGQRFGSTGGVGGSAPPANPGELGTTTGAGNGTTGR
ncbi:hypothetical protein [Bradyrhizobium genosp. P]|uniref:hypothetical protein n=1 Tax=Bradyrhizobium genosp. P TaxID=83641 RepID=UPI003CF2A356